MSVLFIRCKKIFVILVIQEKNNKTNDKLTNFKKSSNDRGFLSLSPFKLSLIL